MAGASSTSELKYVGYGMSRDKADVFCARFLLSSSVSARDNLDSESFLAQVSA